jgi:hypothetical protein
LMADTTGAARDQLIGELHIAVEQIEAALKTPISSEDSKVLKSLLDAVKLSEQAVLEIWQSFHQNPNTRFSNV